MRVLRWRKGTAVFSRRHRWRPRSTRRRPVGAASPPPARGCAARPRAGDSRRGGRGRVTPNNTVTQARRSRPRGAPVDASARRRAARRSRVGGGYARGTHAKQPNRRRHTDLTGGVQSCSSCALWTPAQDSAATAAALPAAPASTAARGTHALGGAPARAPTLCCCCGRARLALQAARAREWLRACLGARSGARA